MSESAMGSLALEEFPHDEYYFYVMDHNGEPCCLHLTEEMVSDMREMVEGEFPSEAGSWLRKSLFDMGGGMWFEFYPEDPGLSKFMFKDAFGGSEERVFGSVFKDKVWFDTGFLCSSTGPPADKHQHHYKRFCERVVHGEHIDLYREKLFEWENSGGWDTDWMDW